MKIAGEKTAIVVVSVDPRECKGKADTSLKLTGEVVTPSKEVEILGVTIDSQLTFASHAQNMRENLNRRMSVLWQKLGPYLQRPQEIVQHLCQTRWVVRSRGAGTFSLRFELEKTGNMQQQSK